MSERDIQNETLIALSGLGLLVWKNDTGVGRSMDGKRVIRFGLVGSPDILGVLPGGRAVGVEVKAPRGRQSEAQRRFQAAFERAGGLYVVARSSDEAVAAVASAMAGEQADQGEPSLFDAWDE